MMKLPISVIVLTCDEEKNIRDCFESTRRYFDEIIVVDSGSTDETLEIAGKYTNKIYHHPFENYAKQRNWAQETLPIKNEWIFHLDADERSTPELLEEVERIFSKPINDISGFMVSRKTIFRNRWIRHGDQYPTYHLRIFKKIAGKCEERLYDQHFVVNGKTRRIKGDIINIIEPDLKVFNLKQERWACLEAQEITAHNTCSVMPLGHGYSSDPMGKRRWLRDNIYYRLPLLIRPFVYFFYRVILRLGFLDGIRGLIFHFWQGFWYRFMVDLKIYELKKNKT